MHSVEPPGGMAKSAIDQWPELRDFSLVLGGPLYQLLRRARLQGVRVEDHVLRRILVICGLIWLPLFVLCLFDGTLVGGVAVPFLEDIETQARFLVAVPLVIVAELVVHQRMRTVVAQFLERGLVPAHELERFRAALRSAMALRNSVTAELVLIGSVAALGYYVRTHFLGVNSPAWYAWPADGGTVTTPAGVWYFGVSNPVFQFLVFRWYFRLFIWTRFLWQVSRLELDLIPTHPDRNGGLGFLGGSPYALSPLIAAHGAAVAGFVANRIFYSGASLNDFKLEIVVLVGVLMLLVLGPLCVFAPRIFAAKRLGLREYGILGAEYTRSFDRRWLRSPDRDGEALLGSSDIQSLADFGNAFGVIREMRGLPFGRDAVVNLVAAALVPFVPLLFTTFPVEVLLDRLIGAVF